MSGLPERASAYSVNDCRFSCHYISLFREILKTSYKTVDIKESMDIHFNQKRIKEAGESRGGASGELFMFSHDNQLILKTLDKEEFEIFSLELKFSDTNPIVPILKLILGIIFLVTSIIWILQM